MYKNNNFNITKMLVSLSNHWDNICIKTHVSIYGEIQCPNQVCIQYEYEFDIVLYISLTALNIKCCNTDYQVDDNPSFFLTKE